jgi:hypothetical protein
MSCLALTVRLRFVTKSRGTYNYPKRSLHFDGSHEVQMLSGVHGYFKRIFILRIPHCSGQQVLIVAGPAALDGLEIIGFRQFAPGYEASTIAQQDLKERHYNVICWLWGFCSVLMCEATVVAERQFPIYASFEQAHEARETGSSCTIGCRLIGSNYDSRVDDCVVHRFLLAGSCHSLQQRHPVIKRLRHET